MPKQNSTIQAPVTLSATDVSIIEAFLEHLERAVKSMRQLADDLAYDDETPLRSEILGAIAEKVQTAAAQIGYQFDPQFAEHREDTDRWIEGLKKEAAKTMERYRQEAEVQA